ncbi:hypothetical protein M9H77_00075 [Catharanthus roseus]|nr:hypothetical protein M9H77_00075 [Catharanthus roseus]
MKFFCSSRLCTFLLLQLQLQLISIFTLSSFPAAADDQNTQSIAVCLANNGVKNFTLFPNNHEDPLLYFGFLNFSIQNLRFTDTSLPKPMAIIMPDTKEKLVKSVQCCRKGSWQIRVRCGGHSYEGTSSVATDGSPFVIIDLMNLNRVSVDMESQTAWVEGGATLGQTYYAISETSKVHGFSAGSCPTVGIGGHISGGGFGLLSRKYGLAADNVVDALLVDADGRLLDREAMGEDVFWAIRGGGGAIWGVVYAWRIQLLNVTQVVTGFIVSRPGTKYHVPKLVNKWQHIAPKLPDDFYLSVFVGAGLPDAETSGISATFKGFYLGPRENALSLLNRVFPELNLAEENCVEMSWIESVVYFSGLESGSTVSQLKDRLLRNKLYFKAKSDYVRKPISRSGIRTAIEILSKEPKGYVILDPYGGMMERLSSESIAFPHREGNLFTIQYLVEWKENEKQKSKEYIEWIRRFYEAMTPYVSGNPRAAYVNYMDLDLGQMSLPLPLLRDDYTSTSASSEDAVERARVWGEKYFLSNYDRLVKAKTLIDPHNIFRHEQGIPPMSSTFHVKTQL